MQAPRAGLKLKFYSILAGGALLVFASVMVGHFAVSTATDEFRALTENELVHERTVAGMVAGFKKQVQEWKNVLLRGADPKQLDKYWGKFQKQEAVLQQDGARLLADMTPGAARDKVEAFVVAHRDMGVAYRKGYDAFIAAGFDPTAGDRAVKGIDRAPTQLLEEAAELIAADAGKVTGIALDDARGAASLSLAATLLTLSIGALACVYLLRRTVLIPLDKIVAVLEQLASGNFQIDIDLRSGDEMGRLADSARRVRDNIGGLIRELTQTAGQLDAAGAQLATLSTQNSARLGQQREGTTQVATASEQLAATAQEVAGGTTKAADAASVAGNASAGGREVVADAVDAIQRLERNVGDVNQVLIDLQTHSAAIGNVLSVIRGIAEQTNLLALNAAIEAARAGDQGRGFAVVADEVRSLAQRTQESTQEIETTIEHLQAGSTAAVQAMEQGRKQVEDGVSRTRKIEQTLREIDDAVSTIVDMNAQIASAAEEQGAVASDVSRNVNAIDQSSGELVDAAQALAASGAQIATLSANLVEVSQRFRV